MQQASRLRRFLDRSVSGDATNIVAEGMVVDGYIKGIGQLIVAGRVKGDCKLSGAVTLAETGAWQGNIEADRVLIAGRLDGSVTATEKLEIAASARITGDVTAGAIAVAQGAVVDGKMQVQEDEAPVSFTEKREPGNGSGSGD